MPGPCQRSLEEACYGSSLSPLTSQKLASPLPLKSSQERHEETLVSAIFSRFYNFSILNTRTSTEHFRFKTQTQTQNIITWSHPAKQQYNKVPWFSIFKNYFLTHSLPFKASRNSFNICEIKFEDFKCHLFFVYAVFIFSIIISSSTMSLQMNFIPFNSWIVFHLI